MLSIGSSSLLTQLYPPYLFQMLGVLGHLWSQNDGIMSWLRLPATLKLPSITILDIYKEFEHIDMLSIGIQQQPYTVIPTLLRSILGFWDLGCQKSK